MLTLRLAETTLPMLTPDAIWASDNVTAIGFCSEQIGVVVFDRISQAIAVNVRKARREVDAARRILIHRHRRLTATVDLGMQERLAGARTATGYSVVPAGLGYSALNRWFLGYPDKAVARSAEAISRAVESGDRFGQVLATVTGAILLFLLRDGAGYAERCEQGHRVSAECGYTWWCAFFEVLHRVLKPTRCPAGQAATAWSRARQDVERATNWAAGTGALPPPSPTGKADVGPQEVDG